MSKRTISMSVGKGSVSHNTRAFHAENTDPERSHLNRIYANQPIQNAYNKLFDEALARFNEKQTRSDRKIADYYEKIRSSKQEKPFHDLIVQVGNMEDSHATSPEGVKAAEILESYMDSFAVRNPNLYVFSAHLHMDEATPHLHIDFIPYTTCSKRGLDTRVSLKQALAAQGFKGGSRGDTEWNQWIQAEKEVLAKVMQRHGLEWEQKGTHHEHLSVLDFKKQERSREVAELSSELGTLREQKTKVQEIEAVAVKLTLFDKSKVTLGRDEFEEIRTLARQRVVQVKEEDGLELENKELRTENQQLRSENHSLGVQLYHIQEAKSKYELEKESELGKLRAEFRRLQRYIDSVLGITKKLGFFEQVQEMMKRINRDKSWGSR